MANEEIIAFGNFRVDVSRRLLWEDDHPCPLRQTPLKVLIELIRHPNVDLTVDHLLKCAWGHFVGPNNVQQAVKKIRRALDDNRKEPRFILTNGSSYRWIGGLKAQSDSPSSLYKAIVMAESD